jgi:hypothetical protein
MSLFQDKKLIVHVSLEVVILGAMTYFFHTRAKSLELRVKSVEEQFSKEITILQDNIVQLKKQLKKSDSVIEEIKTMLKNDKVYVKPPENVKVFFKEELAIPAKQYDQHFLKKTKDYKNVFTAINLTSALPKSTATVEVIDDAVNDDAVIDDAVNDNSVNDNSVNDNSVNDKVNDPINMTAVIAEKDQKDDVDDVDDADDVDNIDDIDKELANELSELVS